MFRLRIKLIMSTMPQASSKASTSTSVFPMYWSTLRLKKTRISRRRRFGRSSRKSWISSMSSWIKSSSANKSVFGEPGSWPKPSAQSGRINFQRVGCKYRESCLEGIRFARYSSAWHATSSTIYRTWGAIKPSKSFPSSSWESAPAIQYASIQWDQATPCQISGRTSVRRVSTNWISRAWRVVCIVCSRTL